jgi:hypothetical protein
VNANFTGLVQALRRLHESNMDCECEDCSKFRHEGS